MKIIAAAALAFAVASTAHAADQITVENIGSVFNQSLALPAEDTPGSGIGFEQYFEFTLPVAETVTLSVSDSGIGNLRIAGGALSLNDWIGNLGVSPFQPVGPLIESSAILDVLGGQEATVAPDVLAAGSYFAEVSGVSGSSPIHLAIDGTITGVTGVGSTATPEPSTWAMLVLGFAGLAWAGFKRRGPRYAA
jgi:PEP-CTERM motif